MSTSDDTGTHAERLDAEPARPPCCHHRRRIRRPGRRRGLRRAPVRITIVDRSNHHLFQPLLYQVATAALSPADIAAPIRRIFRGQENVAVMLAEATAVDVGRETRRAGRRPPSITTS